MNSMSGFELELESVLVTSHEEFACYPCEPKNMHGRLSEDS